MAEGDSERHREEDTTEERGRENSIQFVLHVGIYLLFTTTIHHYHSINMYKKENQSCGIRRRCSRRKHSAHLIRHTE